MMVDADLRTAQSREKRLGGVRASAVLAVRLLMVDALGQIARVQGVPMRGFVGVNGSADFDPLAKGRKSFRLSSEHERKSLAAFLTGNDNNATFAGLIDGEATVNALLAAVCGSDMAAEIRAINRNLA